MALLLLLLGLLTACTSAPRLATSADELQGSTFDARNIAVRNVGGGVLHWTFSSDNPQKRSNKEKGHLYRYDGDV